MTEYLEIGGIIIRLEVSRPLTLSLSEAYQPFLTDHPSAPAAGSLRILPATDLAVSSPSADARLVASGFNDLGESRLFFDGHRYTVGISPCPGEVMRYMHFSPSFREATLYLAPADRWNSFIIDSMSRIFFSQIAILESSFLIHASAVVTSAGSHLFMGRSGTGKSTHSALWNATFPDSSLLNDDNPLVRLNASGSPSVHGTPWSGKTKCWINRHAPLISMTRLRQAPSNRYSPLADVSAFVAVLPGVSVISHSAPLYAKACTTLGAVISGVRIGELECLPDAGAAILCRRHVE